VYNYLTSGESRRYAFARANYADFISATDDSELQPVFDRMQTHGVGYVVVSGDASGVPDQSVYATLADRFGSRPGELRAVEHLRAVYSSEAGDKTVFEVVDGARVIGTGPPNTTMRMTNNISVGDRSFTYERVVRTNRYGEYGVTVPYAGSYDARETSIQITESAVTSGEYTSSYQSHWTFDEGRGETTADALTDATGEVQGATWVDGVRGSALSFDGQDDRVVVNDPRHEPIENGSFTVSLWVKGNLTATDQPFPSVVSVAGANGQGVGVRAQKQTGRLGFSVDDNQGSRFRNFGIAQTMFGNWTHLAAVLDRKDSKIRLYKNGKLISTKNVTGLGYVPSGSRVIIGARAGGRETTGRVDDVRLYSTALKQDQVRALANWESDLLADTEATTTVETTS
jgi:dolichyl-diphosphooligosaccharide--protein glycosyltransferase